MYLILFFLVLFSFLPAFADEIPFNYAQEKSSGPYRLSDHDLSKIDFKIISVQKDFIPKWIDEPGDYSDILQIKFNVTNHELENFKIYKNMFQIDVVDPNQQFPKDQLHHSDFLIDNYYPQYIEDFKLRFQDVVLPSNLIECELINDLIPKTKTKTFSICFDVKQKWSNSPLNLNGPLSYYLLMMENKFSSSCPNCIIVHLNDFYEPPTIPDEISPRKQLSLGMPLEKIICKGDLVLIFKNSQNPACVKSKTAEILKNRGWIHNLQCC